MNNCADAAIFYSRNFGGSAKISAEALPLWLGRAKTELSYLSAGRSDTLDDDKVLRCICEMAEFLYETDGRLGIVSENSDGYSVRYNDADIKSELLKIAKVHLFGTDILYRGDVL